MTCQVTYIIIVRKAFELLHKNTSQSIMHEVPDSSYYKMVYVTVAIYTLEIGRYSAVPIYIIQYINYRTKMYNGRNL